MLTWPFLEVFTWREKGLWSLLLFIGALSPSQRLHPQGLIVTYLLSKGPLANTITLEIRASTYEFRGDTNIQSIAQDSIKSSIEKNENAKDDLSVSIYP